VKTFQQTQTRNLRDAGETMVQQRKEKRSVKREIQLQQTGSEVRNKRKRQNQKSV